MKRVTLFVVALSLMAPVRAVADEEEASSKDKGGRDKGDKDDASKGKDEGKGKKDEGSKKESKGSKDEETCANGYYGKCGEQGAPVKEGR